jgi:hypothetical protein
MPRIISFILIVLLTALPAGAAQDRRVALIIGNGAYTGTAALRNPTNDAAAMSQALEALGFEIILAADSTEAETVARITEFSSRISGARIALFYYAGHGIQIDGRNYLLPVDVAVSSEWALKNSSIDMQEIVRAMETRAQVSIVVLDACRDNPFAAQIASEGRSLSLGRGLGVMDLTGKGAIIAYAAAAGAVASDGSGEHSPYTQALLDEIGSPGVEVGLMLRRVAGRVIDKTRGQQRPELLVRLIDEVYLNPAPALPVPVSATVPVPGRQDTNAPVLLAAADDSADTSVLSTESGRSFFGDMLVIPPDWLTGYTLPQPTGWISTAPATLVDDTPERGFSKAMPLPLAANVETRIAERGVTPWYRIDVPTAGEIQVTIPGTPAEIDIHARIWNANRDVVADWQGAATAGGALDGVYPVPGPGRYWIEVADGGGNAASADPFFVNVDFLPADDPFEPNGGIAAAQPVLNGITIRPAIFPRRDHDWFEFWIDRPGMFSAEATEIPEDMDVVLRVWDYNKDVVHDWVRPARPGGPTILEANLGKPGRYYLQIADSGDNAASVETFTLALGFQPIDDGMEPNDSFGQASLQDPTSTHQIAIFPRRDHDWIAIDVDHPGQLALLATGLPEDIDLVMRVWNAEKDVLHDWIHPYRKGGDTEGSVDLPSPGRYFIQIADSGDNASSIVSFPLSLTFSPQPDQYEPNNRFAEATPLTPGGEILFNILPRRDHDWFRIEVPSSGELTAIIDPSPEDLDIHFRFWNAGRDVLRDWVAPYRQGGVTEGFADLPEAGTYFLQIVDGGDNARAIEPAVLKTHFRPTNDPLEPNNSFGHAAALPLGIPHTAYILPRGDHDWFALDLDRPGTLEVAVENVDEDLDVVFRLWTLDGSVVLDWQRPMRAGGPVYATIPIAEAGQYRLQVADGGDNARSAEGFTILATFE